MPDFFVLLGDIVVIGIITVVQLTTCRHHTDANIIIQSLSGKLGACVCGLSWEGVICGVGAQVGEATLTHALWQSVLLSTATRTSSQVTFPIDFFEHNQQLTDVEFGGNDLLQVYNAQQIKHRLNSTGMYVANTKVRTGSGWVPSQTVLLESTSL